MGHGRDETLTYYDGIILKRGVRPLAGNRVRNTDPNGKYNPTREGPYCSRFITWKFRYKLGIGLLYTCGGNAAKRYDIFHNGIASVFFGKDGIFIPLDFPKIDLLLPPGRQGTNK